MADFREFHLNCGLLVVEDIGRLNGKRPAQLELAYLLDGLIGRQYPRGDNCFGSPRSYCPASNLRLQSRLVAGLTAPLALPESGKHDWPSCSRWSALRQIPISDAAQRALAADFRASVPELFGALIQLKAASDPAQPIDRDAVQRGYLRVWQWSSASRTECRGDGHGALFFTSNEGLCRVVPGGVHGRSCPWCRNVSCAAVDRKKPRTRLGSSSGAVTTQPFCTLVAEPPNSWKRNRPSAKRSSRFVKLVGAA